MKSHFTGLAVAALLVIASPLPGHAEDAAAPAAPAAANQTETPPVSVPRPSLAPKTAEPAAAAPEAAEPAQPRHRRYAHRHWRRYAYWEPFPIFLPHLYHNRIHWYRIPWAFNF
jgi:hypothetical protein